MNLDFSGVQTTLLTLIALALLIAILLALAGSAMYPLAYAVVIVALIYIVTQDSAVITSVQQFLNKMLG